MRLATTVRAAKADQLHRWLIEHGDLSLEQLRSDIPDMTRAELDRAVNDLCAEDRAVIEVGHSGHFIFVTPIIHDDEIAEAA